ncbi:gag-pol polyprotein [Tanacetum coccineum]
MSTSKTYQQSLADAGSETRPPMLERGSYIPWASRFRRYGSGLGPPMLERVVIIHGQTAEDLQAHTGSSSRNTLSYYVTHPTSVVDYDDEYQHDDVQTNSEDPLTSAMLLLARSITQNFSNLTNNRLRTSSNTRNQEIIQGDRMNIQSRNPGNNSTVQCYSCSGKGHYAMNYPKPRVCDSKYFMEQMLLAKQDEAGVILTNEHNDFLFADASRME